MNKHVTSLELSKKLREVGFEDRDNKFFYIKFSDGWEVVFGDTYDEWKQSRDYVRCYLATELLGVMPSVISVNKEFRYLHIEKQQGMYLVNYEYFGNIVYQASDETLPNALAKMIIWLYENKYMEKEK